MWRIVTGLSCMVCVTLMTLVAATPARGQDQAISYGAEVQPIFDTHCVSCHLPGGSGYRKTGLRLDSYEELMRGRVLTPGSPNSSKIVIYIHGGADPYTSMPFGGQSRLKKREIGLITDWIDQGAKNN